MSRKQVKSPSINEKLQIQLETYFEELTAQFERVISTAGSDSFIEIIAKLLASLWNIPTQITMLDIEIEVERMMEKGILIPDIPTYQMRFALEEGAWILLLREYFIGLIKDKFANLIRLEQSIWKTGSKDVDEFVYYLVEIAQIGEEWIKPMYTLWHHEHLYSTLKNFSSRVIASYFQTTIARGQNFMEGAMRLLTAKLKDLSPITSITEISSWGNLAKTHYNTLKSDLETGEFSEFTERIIITLAIFQKELMNYAQEQEQTNTIDQNDEQALDWDNLDPEDGKQKQKFREKIIHLLYQQEDPDPLQAAVSIFDLISDKRKIHSKYVQKFQLMINMQLRSITDQIEREKRLVEIIQNNLPEYLIDLKREINSYQTQTKAQKDVNELPIWDSFLDTLQRVPRLNDDELSFPIVNKAIRSLYFTLIDRKMDPKSASKFILEELQLRMAIDSETISRIQDELSQEIEHVTIDDLAIIDKKIIKKFTEEFHKLAKL